MPLASFVGAVISEETPTLLICKDTQGLEYKVVLEEPYQIEKDIEYVFEGVPYTKGDKNSKSLDDIPPFGLLNSSIYTDKEHFDIDDNGYCHFELSVVVRSVFKNIISKKGGEYNFLLANLLDKEGNYVLDSNNRNFIIKAVWTDTDYDNDFVDVVNKKINLPLVVYKGRLLLV